MHRGCSVHVVLQKEELTSTVAAIPTARQHTQLRVTQQPPPTHTAAAWHRHQSVPQPDPTIHARYLLLVRCSLPTHTKGRPKECRYRVLVTLKPTPTTLGSTVNHCYASLHDITAFVHRSLHLIPTLSVRTAPPTADCAATSPSFTSPSGTRHAPSTGPFMFPAPLAHQAQRSSGMRRPLRPRASLGLSATCQALGLRAPRAARCAASAPGWPRPP